MNAIAPIYRFRALTGDDLRDFVDRQFFPYLHGFKQKASGTAKAEPKVFELDSDLDPKID